ncbi:MAG: hypothetical protein KIT14_08175 [bacterium]|nr:hypothetical protein [bacterium]
MAAHLRLVTPLPPAPPPAPTPANPCEAEARALVAAWIDAPLTSDREPLDDLVLRIAERLAAVPRGSESLG